MLVNLIIYLNILKKIKKKVSFFNFIFLYRGYVFNNFLIDEKKTIYYNMFYTFGLKTFFFKFIEIRTEKKKNFLINSFGEYYWKSFLKNIYSIIPKSCSILNRKVFNIYVLEAIGSYRGWYHYRGLPVRGQRTWSNASSVFKSNKILRDFKLKNAKMFYGNIPERDISTAFIAEHVNMLWKNQWYLEWKLARKDLLNFSGNLKTMKIDIYSMSNYQVLHPLKLKTLSKKQKQSFKKNHFSLGFELGFTKPLLRSFYKVYQENEDDSKLLGAKIVLKNDKIKKTNVKKKINEKVKKITHVKKIKNKKSLWD